MIFLVFAMLVIGLNRAWNNHIHWRYNPRNIELYMEDYMRIVDLAFQEFKLSSEDLIMIGVDYDLLNRKESMVDASLVKDGIELSLTDKEKQSLKNICNNSFRFNSRFLSFIEVDENQVEFWPESCGFALIYTKDGSKPKMDIITSDPLKFKKIHANWYQMSRYKDVVFFHD